jgi:hypothetical protein
VVRFDATKGAGCDPADEVAVQVGITHRRSTGEDIRSTGGMVIVKPGTVTPH